MRSKKRLQMQRKSKRPHAGHPRTRNPPIHKPEQVLHQESLAEHPSPANMAELERQHATWLARRGQAYISLAETARLWNRKPEQIIRWERLLDEKDDGLTTRAD